MTHYSIAAYAILQHVILSLHLVDFSELQEVVEHPFQQPTPEKFT